MKRISYISNPILQTVWRTFLLTIFIVNVGCSAISSSVIAATGTTIGVEISQNQTTQTPILILGYKRAEFAYVPTNKQNSEVADLEPETVETSESNKGTAAVADQSVEVQPVQTNNGARDSANVLMELKYFGIFSTGSDSGIYQRLAVGDIAVAHKGAELLFSRDSAGSIDPRIASYIAQAQYEITIEELQLKKIISYVTDGSDAVNKETLTALVTEAKKNTDTQKYFTDGVVAEILSKTTGKNLYTTLFEVFDDTITPLYNSLPNDKQ